MKPFSQWSDQDVADYNARRQTKEVRQNEGRPQVVVSNHPVGRAHESTTRIDLSPRPTTDESKLNKTERAYLWHLRKLNVPLLRIQQHTLKLADDCRLTVDFTYMNANGRLVFVDVKGFQREDALIKMKVAARQFPEFDFVIVKREKGQWNEKVVHP